MNSTDWIGWLASAVLLLTIGRQVFTQWKSNSSAGVSKWLFVGQVTASIGFTIYSYLLHNWVFLCSNVALLFTAVLGQYLYWRNRKKPREESLSGVPGWVSGRISADAPRPDRPGGNAGTGATVEVGNDG
jgi:MtN3 and saliva related transmembrane protein